MKTMRRSLSVALVSALALSGLGLSASADEPDVKRLEHKRATAGTKVSGIIVKTTTRKPSATVVRKTDVLLDGEANPEAISAIAPNTNAIALDDAIPVATAETVAAQLEKRDDVVWAEPDYVRHPVSNPAVTPADPFFAQQYNVWDRRSYASGEVKAILNGHKFPRGGFSIKAPDVWPTTMGAATTAHPNDVVVAVLDTGRTEHSELADSWVAGYDMLSTTDYSNDGDGRDADPADPGDWETAGFCDAKSPESDSSWHGTAVAGIIAAKHNTAGISGIAPGVKIEPVRVLGRCGGPDSDIAAGILWAAGLPVPGIDDLNANPADVINLSLSGESPCAQELADAIKAARTHGSVVVTAAGNDDKSAAAFSPGNCAGVINVGATDEYGFRAEYSNYGSKVTLSAPGGDFTWDDRGIISTWNDGATEPGAEAYVEADGTSFAAPEVSAGAALMASLGFGRTRIESAVRASVQGFTTYNPGIPTRYLCTTTTCGRGAFDLSKMNVASTRPRVVSEGAAPVVGKTVSAGNASWFGSPTSFTYEWYLAGSKIAGETARTYVVRAGDVDQKLGVRVTSNKTGFGPIPSKLGESAAVRIPSTTTLSVPLTTGTHGQTAGFVVNFGSTADGETPAGNVQILKGTSVISTGTLAAGTLTIPGAKLPAGSYGMTAKFLGAGRVGESTSAPINVTINKAKSSISTSLWKSVSHTKRAKLTVWVRASGVLAPTGTIKVYDGTKRIQTFTLSSGYKGTRTVSLPKITKKGKHKIKVVYSGNSNIIGRTATVRTLRVK